MAARRRGAAQLCDCLSAVLKSELSRGNGLAQPPHRAGWPQDRSVFAALTNELRTPMSALPPGVRHQICTDPRYGWHDECFCTEHQDLLVAGTTRMPG